MTIQERRNDKRKKEARERQPRVGTYAGIHTTYTHTNTHSRKQHNLALSRKKKRAQKKRSTHLSLAVAVARVVLLDARFFPTSRARALTHTTPTRLTQSRQGSRLLERLGHRHGDS